MEPRCPACSLDFRREPGFYLGSISINYGITALTTIALYGLLVLVFALLMAAVTLWFVIGPGSRGGAWDDGGLMEEPG